MTSFTSSCRCCCWAVQPVLLLLISCFSFDDVVVDSLSHVRPSIIIPSSSRTFAGIGTKRIHPSSSFFFSGLPHRHQPSSVPSSSSSSSSRIIRYVKTPIDTTSTTDEQLFVTLLGGNNRTDDDTNSDPLFVQQLEENFALSSSSSNIANVDVADVNDKSKDDDGAAAATLITTQAASDESLSLSSLLSSSTSTSGSTTTTTTDDSDNIDMSIWVARGILLLVAAIWGTNFASVKYLENLCFHPPCSHPPSEFAFVRFGIAGIVSLPILYNSRKRLDVITAGMECGLWITLGYISQAVALATISSAKCAFICSLTVVFVPVVSAILYGKKIQPLNIVAAIVALLGVGVLEGMVNIPELLSSISPTASTADPTATTVAAATAATATTAGAGEAIAAATTTTTAAATASAGPLASLASTLGISKGDIIALGQPIGFGYAFTRIEHVQEQYKDVPNRVLTIAAAQCLMVGLLSFGWVLWDFNGVLPNFSYMMEWHRVVALLWTGIVTTVFAIYLEGIALQKATATDASLAFASEPVWASMFGFVLLHETLGFNSYVGGSIILLACLVGSFSDLLLDKEQQQQAEAATTTTQESATTTTTATETM